MNIYELHARFPGNKKEDGSWYNYEELAEELIPYLKKMGFNYIEFSAIYRNIRRIVPGDIRIRDFFAPTSRYGTPQQLKKLVELCHENGIGVFYRFLCRYTSLWMIMVF